MKHTLSVLLRNKPGALSRVTGLFSGRCFNIESLCVAETFDPQISCLTVVTSGEAAIIEQITKQLHKLVDVLKVSDITEGSHIEREIMLVKSRANTPDARDEVKRLSEIFRGQIVDVTPDLYTVQLVGTSDKLDAFIGTMKQATEIVEVVRSGVCGIARGERSLHA